MPKNEQCVVTDSDLCKWINKDCANCYLREMKDDSDTKKVLEDFQVMLSLLPDEFDSLQGDNCCFCKGESQKRVCYATVDLGHKDPEHKRGMFFGIGKKVRQRIGSLIPVSLSICADCRRNFRLAESLKWMMMLLFGGIALGICFIPALNANPILPYAIILAGILVGYITGKIFSTVYVNKKAEKTRFNVFDVPVCAEMAEKGWFTIQDEGPVTRFIFSKKPMVKRLSDVGIEQKKEQENI